MATRYTWHDEKRRTNLVKHQLDFLLAPWVLESPHRLEVDTERHGEKRKQAFAYVFEVLTVLTVVYRPGQIPHIISFRRANRNERDVYHDWLENDYDGT